MENEKLKIKEYFLIFLSLIFWLEVCLIFFMGIKLLFFNRRSELEKKSATPAEIRNRI